MHWKLHAPHPCAASSRQMLSDGTCFVLFQFQMNGWSLQFSCYSVGTFDIDLQSTSRHWRRRKECNNWSPRQPRTKQIMHGIYVFKPFDRLLLLRWWCLDLFAGQNEPEWVCEVCGKFTEITHVAYQLEISLAPIEPYCIQILRTKTRLKKSEVTISYPRVQKVSKIRRHPRHWNSLHHRLWEFWDQVWASCVHIPVFSSHDQASVALFIKLPHTAWQLSNSPWVLRKSAKALKDRGTILSSVHQSRIIMNNVDTPRWRFPKMGSTLIIQIRLFSI